MVANGGSLGAVGTVWDSLAFDPELDLLYVGVGNGAPWSRQTRSPGGGDNLYLASILALRPDNGDLIWYYQTTPGETWDYTATQHMILADLEIKGRLRKVLMQAPKNGFFYVLDRATGELISAQPYVNITWAHGVDLRSGRPIEAAGARYESGPATIFPSALGGHNWMPMSFNPHTGLVYIPAQEIGMLYDLEREGFTYTPARMNLGTNTLDTLKAVPADAASGHLSAWDPVQQREVWRVPYTKASNGGTLTTAGNLVFQGTADGRFVAYTADKGEKVWEFFAQTGIVEAPITYTIDGEQYISVLAGWGGVFALIFGEAAAANQVRHVGRLLTFKLGATGSLPPLAAVPAIPQPPAVEAPVEVVDAGELLYLRNCVVCHGAGVVSGGVLPDLRHSGREVFAAYQDIVLRGALEGQGMPRVDDRLQAEDVEAIKAFILTKGWDDYVKWNNP
jgi:quinohemoprotein ethanol dehydrogenase